MPAFYLHNFSNSSPESPVSRCVFSRITDNRVFSLVDAPLERAGEIAEEMKTCLTPKTEKTPNQITKSAAATSTPDVGRVTPALDAPAPRCRHAVGSAIRLDSPGPVDFGEIEVAFDRIADLLGRVNVVLCPAWNTDTSSYDHLIQSVGFQLHSFVAIANNGHYSDCRAWAPRTRRWERDRCRLIERDVDDVVHVDIPLSELVAFHDGQPNDAWRPLPPDWP
jgi:hypothetical protein